MGTPNSARDNIFKSTENLEENNSIILNSNATDHIILLLTTKNAWQYVIFYHSSLLVLRHWAKVSANSNYASAYYHYLNYTGATNATAHYLRPRNLYYLVNILTTYCFIRCFYILLLFYNGMLLPNNKIPNVICKMLLCYKIILMHKFRFYQIAFFLMQIRGFSL